MESIDGIVLRTLADWRKEGLAALLLTVVRTWGSSPRPVGSIMALCENGTVVGSVSGGVLKMTSSPNIVQALIKAGIPALVLNICSTV